MPGIKLFLVDDDEIFSSVAEILIKAEGLASEVVRLENGMEAFDALVPLAATPEELPEILFLDINMPIMNGWEFLEELKSADEVIREKVQIHVLTSSIAPEDLNLSKNYEFIKGYITKPLTKNDIVKVKEGVLSDVKQG